MDGRRTLQSLAFMLAISLILGIALSFVVARGWDDMTWLMVARNVLFFSAVIFGTLVKLILR